MPITSAEYVAKGGNECPHCHSGNLSGGRFEMDSDGGWQTITCEDCGAEWNDLYKLTGYQPTQEPTSDEEE